MKNYPQGYAKVIHMWIAAVFLNLNLKKWILGYFCGLAAMTAVDKSARMANPLLGLLCRVNLPEQAVHGLHFSKRMALRSLGWGFHGLGRVFEHIKA